MKNFLDSAYEANLVRLAVTSVIFTVDEVIGHISQAKEMGFENGQY